MDVACSCTGDDGQADGHPKRGAHEHFASPKNVVEPSAGAGKDPACDGVYGIEEELGVSVRYADVFNEKRKILKTSITIR